MSIDLRTLKRVDPETPARPSTTEETMVVAVVKLHPDHTLPDYVEQRARLAERFFTVNVPAEHWARLNHDPAVEAVERSRRWSS